jgi:hypothetical protein
LKPQDSFSVPQKVIDEQAIDDGDNEIDCDSDASD